MPLQHQDQKEKQKELPPGIHITKIHTQNQLDSFRILNKVSLPISYPEKFYKQILSKDDEGKKIGDFVRVAVYNSSSDDDGSGGDGGGGGGRRGDGRDVDEEEREQGKVVGGIRCRLEDILEDVFDDGRKDINSMKEVLKGGCIVSSTTTTTTTTTSSTSGIDAPRSLGSGRIGLGGIGIHLGPSAGFGFGSGSTCHSHTDMYEGSSTSKIPKPNILETTLHRSVVKHDKKEDGMEDSNDGRSSSEKLGGKRKRSSSTLQEQIRKTKTKKKMKKKRIYIQTLAVLAPFRGLGIASRLLGEIIDSNVPPHRLQSFSSRTPSGMMDMDMDSRTISSERMNHNIGTPNETSTNWDDTQDGVVNENKDENKDEDEEEIQITEIYAHVHEQNTSAIEWYVNRGFRKQEPKIEGYYRKMKPGGAYLLWKSLL